jgi:hypothetical protein
MDKNKAILNQNQKLSQGDVKEEDLGQNQREKGSEKLESHSPDVARIA